MRKCGCCWFRLPDSPQDGGYAVIVYRDGESGCGIPTPSASLAISPKDGNVAGRIQRVVSGGSGCGEGNGQRQAHGESAEAEGPVGRHGYGGLAPKEPPNRSPCLIAARVSRSRGGRLKANAESVLPSPLRSGPAAPSYSLRLPSPGREMLRVGECPHSERAPLRGQHGSSGGSAVLG